MNIELNPDDDQISKKVNPVELTCQIGGRKFPFLVYHVGLHPEGAIPSPGQMETGSDNTKELLRLWGTRSVCQHFYGYPPLPYSFLRTGSTAPSWGNFTTKEGQRRWSDTDMQFADTDGFSPDPKVSALWQYTRLAGKKTFRLNESVLCLRGVQNRGNRVVCLVGPGLYSDSYYSNGMGGMTITEPTEDQIKRLSSEEQANLRELYEIFKRKGWEGMSIRQIISELYRGLPEINARTHNHGLGVASVVLTRDHSFAFVLRGKNVSVNQGVNCTASGAAIWDPNLLSSVGLPTYLGQQIHREVRDELGLPVFDCGRVILGAINNRIVRELNLSTDQFWSIPVGLVGELSREGKPEVLFLTYFKGTNEDLVESIARNTNPEVAEIAGEVSFMEAGQTFDLNREASAGIPFHHKLRITLVLIERALKNNSTLRRQIGF